MSTSITTTNPVRSDVPAGATDAPARPQSRTWALAGLGAAISSLVGTVAAGFVQAVYSDDIMGDDAAILAALGADVTTMTVFHVAISIAAVLLVVFAAGLVRRLRSTLPADSLVPLVAGAGVLATAVVWVLAGALDTEFIFGAAAPDTLVPATAAVYNHWIGTVPGCTMLIGLGGLGVFAAARQGAAPRWMGVAGLVLGGLTVLLGVSPLQYMAAMTSALWLLVTSLGFAFGDRTHRRAV